MEFKIKVHTDFVTYSSAGSILKFWKFPYKVAKYISLWNSINTEK